MTRIPVWRLLPASSLPSVNLLHNPQLGAPLLVIAPESSDQHTGTIINTGNIDRSDRSIASTRQHMKQFRIYESAMET
jgi:hypothetical protein